MNSTVGHNVKLSNRCFLGSNNLLVKNAGDESVFIEPETRFSKLKSPQFLEMSGFDNR